ncbi:MAG: iron complex outermembrane recepter protein [Candidatus Magnetoglobus multicellularis str. Araruama]|uniref:Iron complex outermembrane recepter protein n=1 Tax=Candidatus Magnetoglobus multicellularis str. Araruama TaxID=890399 RepID=A0A1V1P4D2_9BACT|nr:MAG: iron complex outermembrane recepter protein [Candidatus Magnetoglobus multicellularis str. Araruama]
MMLNNISMTDSIASLNDTLLDFPISLMERIEIVRGPGSAIYGEYAYAGVINIITRKTNSLVSLRIASLASISSSALLNHYSQDQSTHLSLMAHQFKTDGSDAITGPDAYYQESDRQSISLAPGSPNETLKGKSVLLSVKHKDTSFSGQMANIYRGYYMGYYHYLYNLSEDTPHKHRQHAFQLSHKIRFNPQLNLTIRGGSQRYRYFFDHYYMYPPDYPGLPEGLILSIDSIERKKYATVDFTYSLDKHQFLFSLEYSSIKSLFITSTTEMYRHIYTMVSQYECQPFENFSLTLGARYDNYEDKYDNYDDIDHNISPRIAGVYHLTSKQIIKCQYQKAFRPATTGELVYSTDIKPPTINTYELSYTYKSPFTRGRINLYYSVLKDVIDTTVKDATIFNPKGTFIYFNANKIRSNGIELELEHQLLDQLKINTNAAFMYTKNLDTNKSMPLQTNFIGNAGLIYSPLPLFNISTWYRYMGNRTREVGDNRNELAGYHNLDMSMCIHAAKISTKIRLGINNVLNEDIYVPTPVSHIYFKEQTYLGDYPRKARSMWFDITYEF